MIQALKLREQSDQGQLNQISHFDLVICDEAHETAGTASKAAAQAVLPDVLPATWRLFMTATPRILDLQDRPPWHRAAAPKQAAPSTPKISMDDTSLYGEVVYQLTFRDSIERGVTVPVKLVVIDVSDSYRRAMAKYPELRLLEQEDTESDDEDEDEDLAFDDENEYDREERQQDETFSKKKKKRKARLVQRNRIELALSILDACDRQNLKTVFSFHSTNRCACLCLLCFTFRAERSRKLRCQLQFKVWSASLVSFVVNAGRPKCSWRPSMRCSELFTRRVMEQHQTVGCRGGGCPES